MTQGLLFVLICLASYRATRLAIHDSILDGPRARWFRRFDPFHHPAGQLFACSWCLGWWVCGATVGLLAWLYTVRLPLLQWPAASTVVGFLGSKLEDT